MTTLNDDVRQVIDSFMTSGELFTALDVSNKVKLTNPFARHGEIRDVVRDLFSSVMQPASWAKTPIQVTLADGSQREALLYHPLSDSWDLDEKYDAQKRAQVSVKPGPLVSTLTAVPSGNGWCGTPAPGQPVIVQGSAVLKPVGSQPKALPAAPVKDLPAKDKWAQLFDTQPSLFPRK